MKKSIRINSEEIRIHIYYDPTVGISPTELASIITGFNGYFTLLPKFAKINRCADVRVVKVQSGSVILSWVIGLIENGKEIFKNATDLFDYLTLIDYPDLKDLKEYWNSIQNVDKKINDLIATHPFELLLGSILAKKLWNKIEQNKTSKANYKTETKIEAKARKYLRKALKPIANTTVKKIELSSKKEFGYVLNESSLKYVMSKNDEILPEWKNNDKVKIIGKVMSMKGLRLPSLTVAFNNKNRKYNIDAIPEDNHQIKQYAQYFQEECIVHAIVIRKNEFVKPKLKLISIEEEQKDLYK